MATKKQTTRGGGGRGTKDQEMEGLQSNPSPGINYEDYNEQFGEGSSGKTFLL